MSTEGNCDEGFGTDYFEMEEFLQNSYDDLSPRTSSPIPLSEKSKLTTSGDNSSEKPSTSASASTTAEIKSPNESEINDNSAVTSKTKHKKGAALKIKLMQKKKGLKSKRSTSTPEQAQAKGDNSESPSTSQATSKPIETVIQLKVTLQGVKPLIWRRIHVFPYTTIKALHVIIQQAMGWGLCHLHQFRKSPPTDATAPAENFGDDLSVNQNANVSEYFRQKGDMLYYIYDFKDGWNHVVKFEKILTINGQNSDYPKLVSGKRACPPEDCGGPSMYQHLVEVFNNPTHPEYEDLIENWLQPLYPGWHPEMHEKPRVLQMWRFLQA